MVNSIEPWKNEVFKKSGVVNQINIPSIAYILGHVFFKQGKFIFDGSGGNINFQGTIKPNWKKPASTAQTLEDDLWPLLKVPACSPHISTCQISIKTARK